MMLDELQRRNYAQSTVETYISALREFAAYFKRPPDQLGPEHIRQFQLYLIRDRKLATNTVQQRMAAIQFFFARTLKRAYLREDFPYPKVPRRLPVILSQEEVTRLIDSASNLSHRAILMTLYSTGMRRAELVRLKLEDVDSRRMVIHVRQGKGSKDRCESIGDGPSRKATCFPVSPASAAPMCRSLPRLCGTPATAPHKGRVSQRRSAPTVFATRMQPICWNPALTCIPFKCCWVMPTSSTPRFTCIFPSATCMR
jgi:hypothetical protein